MTTAGTDRMPRPLARLATWGSFISSTVTSHEGQATRLTIDTVSSQTGQPALNISTLRLVATFISPVAPDLEQRFRGSGRNALLRPRIPQRNHDHAAHAPADGSVVVEDKLADN